MEIFEKSIGIIPARKNSKKLPGKNIKVLNGKPLIAHTIEIALKSGLERVIVSTDSNEIAGISKQYGAETPFLRPQELAQDNSSDRVVFEHLLRWLDKNENYIPKRIAHLRCTTPLKTVGDIQQGLLKIHNSNYDSIRSVTKVDGVFHPYWMFKEDNDSLTSFVDHINLKKYYQRQLLPTTYRLNGVVDILNPDVILNHDSFWGDKIGKIIIPEQRSIDIDTLADFEYAEYLMNKKE